MPPKRVPAARPRIGARAAAAASAAAPALYSFAGLLAAIVAAFRMLMGWVVTQGKDKVKSVESGREEERPGARVKVMGPRPRGASARVCTLLARLATSLPG